MRRFRTYPQIGGKKGGIPSGWVEVEYLETKGAQWIETGVAPSLDMTLECGIYFTVMVDEYFCSCRINTGNTRYYLVNINATYGLVTTKSSWPGASVKLPSEFVSTRHDVVATIGRDSVSIEVDGTKNEFQDSVAVISSKTLPLFGGKVNDSDVANAFSRAGTRCYYARFTSLGSVVRSFVPVRDAVTNEGAMCDVLTGDIYRNQGTGTFVVGPDKAAWVNPYVTDAAYIMWDAEWNAGGGHHDSELRMKNLVHADDDIVLPSTSTMLDNYVQFSGRNGASVVRRTDEYLKFLNGWTAEVCVDLGALTYNSKFFAVGYLNSLGNYPSSGGSVNTIVYGNVNSAGGGVGVSDHINSAYNQCSLGKHTYAMSVDIVNNLTIIYKDGVEIARKSVGAYSGDEYQKYNYERFAINDQHDGRSLFGFEDAKYACMRVYTKALTPAEIAANFAVDRTRFNIA